MDFKEKLRNPQVQQSILEVVFPIAGYLFWDWSLMIIIVFYLLDYLASQIFFIRRLYFTMSFKNELKYKLIVISIFSFFVFFSIELLMLNDSIAFVYKNTEKSHFDELIKFVKDEMWLLFPTILLLYYMLDKMFFYMPRRFVKLDAKVYVIKNLIANIIVLFLIAVGKFVFDKTSLHDLVVVFGIIGVKLFFDLYVKKKKLNILY